MIRNQVGLQRMNLSTKTWRLTPLVQPDLPRSQMALDVQGLALYYLAPFGGDAYLAFDQGNQVIFVPNNINFAGRRSGWASTMRIPACGSGRTRPQK
jgi:hypothetical protein